MAALLVWAAWALREESLREEPITVISLPAGGAGADSGARSLPAGDQGETTMAAGVPDFREAMARRQRSEERRAEREIARMREQRRREEETLARTEAERVSRVDDAANQNRSGSVTTRDAARTMSHREFQRRNAAPPRTSSSDAPAGRPGPRIDVGAVLQSGGGPWSATGPESATAGDRLMDDYFGGLVARLQAAHEKPAGLTDLLSVEVSFTLSKDGSISSPRILRSSGDAAFDRSVLAVFGRVRMPARPDGKSSTERITFRTRDA